MTTSAPNSYARWDIVKVPFPFTEGIGDKRRPALIISTKSLSRTHRLYWLLMITSVVKPAWAGDIAIRDYAAVGLPVASIIRTAKIATLQHDRIAGRIGSLSAADIADVRTALGKWLDI